MTLALTVALLAQAPATLAGTWELDPEASDDPGPMMELLGVPGWMRGLAPKKPTQKLTLGAGTLTISAQTMKGARSETLQLDGKTPTKADLMGTAVEFVSTVEGDTVVSRGTIAVDGGREPLVMRRSATAVQMTSVLSIGTRQLKRVFRRLPAER